MVISHHLRCLLAARALLPGTMQRAQRSALPCTPLRSHGYPCLLELPAPPQTCHVFLHLSALVCATFSVWNILILCPPGEIIIIFQNPYPAAPWFFEANDVFTPSLVSSCMHSFKDYLLSAYHVYMCSILRRLWQVGSGGYFNEGVTEGSSGQSLHVVRE